MDSEYYTGKICIVTGANSGIGYSLSEELLKRGAIVYLAGRSREKIDAAAAQLQEGTEPAGRWRYAPDQGWQSESFEAAPMILHTFAEPGLVRDIENYVLFWEDQDAGQLADELVELAIAAKTDGLVAVIVRV